MTLALYGKSKRRQTSLLLLGVFAVFAAMLGGVTIYHSDSAKAAPITVVDEGGPNDVSGDGQKDLTKLTIDNDGLPTSLAVTWNWDESSVPGGNSMDACSLYDTDGDGNANFAICVVVLFNPGPSPTTVLWSCSDGANDKCTAPNSSTTSISSHCDVAVSDDDPFPEGDSYPDDLQATCNIVMADVAASGATLLNVCSYPSASPTSNPNDCVLVPGTRTLTIMKVTDPGTHPGGTFTGTISPGLDTSFSVTLPADTAVSPAENNTVTLAEQTVTETPLPANWSNAGYYVQPSPYTCTGAETGYTNVGGSATVPAGNGNYTVCIKNTYTSPVQPSVSVTKTHSDIDGSAGDGNYSPTEWFTFTLAFQVSGAALTSAMNWNDQLPDGIGFVGLGTSVNPGNQLNCGGNQTTDEVFCSLQAGTPVGTYSYNVTVEVEETAVCGPVVNNVRIGAIAGEGDIVATDTVTITGCFQNPTVSKVKDDPALAGGIAYWEIRVDNTANTNLTAVVFIQDSGATLGAVTGGTCIGANLDTGIVCTVTAGATLVVNVSKTAPTAQCLPQTINNSASIWLGRTNQGTLLGTVGGDATTEITVPADLSTCGQPSISKTLVGGGDAPTAVTDPANVEWTVTVTNPATLPGTNQTVVIRDANVVVTSGPSFTGGASCAPNNDTADFQAALTGAGVSCTMPGGESTTSTITFDVRPAGTIARTCADQVFNNTASIQIGTQPAVNAVGPTITLQGNPELCTRDLEICKVVVGNGDGAVISGGFNFLVREDGIQTINGLPGGAITASEPNPDTTAGVDGAEVCQTVQVSTTKTIQVVEWGSRPDDWTEDAANYPMYSINDGAQVSNGTTSEIAAGSSDLKVTFFNRAVPATKTIIIEKRFVDLNGTEWGIDDIPTFTFTNPSIDPECTLVPNGAGDHAFIECTVPWDWDGDVSENVPADWEEVDCTPSTAPTQVAADFVFCNRPLGDVVIVKYENVPPAGAQNWNFTGTLPPGAFVVGTIGTTNSTGVTQLQVPNVPVGSYTLAELQGEAACQTGDTSDDYQTRGLVQVGGSLPGAAAIMAAPIIAAANQSVTVEKGATTYVVFGNQGCGSVLTAANLQVSKFSDPAANFTGTTNLTGWQITITGTAGAATGFNASETTGASGAFFLGIPDGTYTVCETAQANWAVVGSKYNAVNQAGVCRTGVVANLGQTATVNFYNQPRVNIEVNKNEISSATPAGGPGAGWSFSLTGCGVGPLVQVTGANGKATFSNLPPAVGCSYTVTETVKAGWSAINPVQVTAPTAAGQTAVLTFTNILIEVCTNCVTPTPTPTTPTPTPTPQTPTPTPTPTEPPATVTETPTETTAGERTPGPGQTPIPPSAGNGIAGSGSNSTSLVLAFLGLLAISTGTTILAFARKSSRR